MTQTIFSGNIAGIAHANPEFEFLNAEDAVGLIPEPQNGYDRNAIRVSHSEVGKLGYIPREATICIHDAKQNGFIPVGRIVSANNSGKFPKIHLVVTIEI